MRVRCITNVLFALLLCAGTLLAAQEPQQPAQAPPPASPTSEKGVQPAQGPSSAIVVKATDQTGEAIAAPPAVTVPQAEPLEGYIDFGYRWLLRQNGSEQMYRTLVNLGEGPKFFGAHISWRRAKLWDRFEFDSTSWGDEPYSNARLYIERAGYYEIGLQYREQHYFSDVPSFANPLLPIGFTISQNSYDYTRRLGDFDIRMLPNGRLTPFFSYSHTGRSGPGFWPWVGPGNEYLVSTLFDDNTNLFRGGVNINLKRLYLTLEGGGTFFNDNQHTFFSGFNPGNRRTPLFGQTMFLNTVNQQYTVEANMGFFRTSFTAKPISAIDIAGQFAFSQPSGRVTFSEVATGQLVSSTTPQTFTGLSNSGPGRALMPRPSGNISMIARPWRRVRIVESYDTVRFHNDSSIFLTQTLTGLRGLLGTVTPTTLTTISPAFDFVTSDYERNQIEAIVQVLPRLYVRGGWRAEWQQWVQPSDEPGEFEAQKAQRNVALGGIDVSFPVGASLSLTTEVGIPKKTLYRIDLNDYHKVTAGGRWNILPWLRLNGKYMRLFNNNDAPDIQLEAHNQMYSFGLLLAPNNGKRITFSADWMYSTYDSNVLFLIPSTLTPAVSSYHDNSSFLGSFVNVNLFHGATMNFGGTMLVGHGTRPTKYYQPHAELMIPLHPRVTWFNNWQYWDYAQKFIIENTNPFSPHLENFNAQLFSTGLRINLNKPQ